MPFFGSKSSEPTFKEVPEAFTYRVVGQDDFSAIARIGSAYPNERFPDKAAPIFKSPKDRYLRPCPG